MVTRTIEIGEPKADLSSSHHPYVLVATYLPLRSFSKVIPFFTLSNKVEAQLRSSKGLVRYAIRTDILHKRFWTFSVWTDRDIMMKFSRSEPHLTAIKKFYEWGTDRSGIAEWSSPTGEIDWKEADKRLKIPMFRYRSIDGKTSRSRAS